MQRIKTDESYEEMMLHMHEHPMLKNMYELSMEQNVVFFIQRGASGQTLVIHQGNANIVGNAPDIDVDPEYVYVFSYS